MNEEHDYSNSPSATPGGAPVNDSVSSRNTFSQRPPDTRSNMADDGAAVASLGVAVADGSQQPSKEQSYEDWATPGVAIMNTNDTRLYLFDVHDILLRDRYTQKLVTDYQKLDGKRAGKEGGGAELHIKVPSIDAYAAAIKKASVEKYGDETSHKNHGSNAVIDPNDKLFLQLLKIAHTKPYAVAIEGDARPTTETSTTTPPSAPTASTETPAPQAPQNPEPEPSAQQNAGASVQPAQIETVPREMYELAMSYTDKFERLYTTERAEREAEREAYAKERNGLIDDLGTAYNKIADMNQTLIELTERQPTQLLDGIIGLLQGEANPHQPKLITPDQASRFHPIKNTNHRNHEQQ